MKLILQAFVSLSIIVFLMAPCWATKTDDLTPTQIHRAKVLLEGRCGMCHAAPKPKDYTLQEWPGIINHMGPKAGLRQSEMDLLVKYMEYSFKNHQKAGSTSQ